MSELTRPDEIMTRIGAAMALGQQGDRIGARHAFEAIWADIGPAGDPLHRVALAHSMADVQDDVNEEIVWDLRALEAADGLTDARAREAGVVSPVAAFYPSLHLNLGEAYRKLGDPARARHHCDEGRRAVGALADDGYGAMVRDALDRLAARIADEA
jgi:hypothetical protein